MTTNRSSYSSRTDPSQLASRLFDELSRRYHEERHRVDTQQWQILVRYRPGEAESLLNLALNWVPYGGIPEEEVFEHYGTTLARFVDQLWVAVHHLQCDRKTVVKLATVYPKWRSSPNEYPELSSAGD